MRQFFFFIFVFVCITFPSDGQVLDRLRQKNQNDVGSVGIIKGRVIDEKSKEGLPSVNITVKGTYYGAASDFDGY